jgi:hypothetical protein
LERGEDHIAVDEHRDRHRRDLEQAQQAHQQPVADPHMLLQEALHSGLLAQRPPNHPHRLWDEQLTINHTSALLSMMGLCCV